MVSAVRHTAFVVQALSTAGQLEAVQLEPVAEHWAAQQDNAVRNTASAYINFFPLNYYIIIFIQLWHRRGILWWWWRCCRQSRQSRQWRMQPYRLSSGNMLFLIWIVGDRNEMNVSSTNNVPFLSFSCGNTAAHCGGTSYGSCSYSGCGAGLCCSRFGL